MSDTPITERQQYWLEHLQAAVGFDGSIADYARSAGLKPKELYQWKTILIRRGFWGEPPVASEFVQVATPAWAAGLSLVLPNGVRLEFHGVLAAEQVDAVVAAASRLA